MSTLSSIAPLGSKNVFPNSFNFLSSFPPYTTHFHPYCNSSSHSPFSIPLTSNLFILFCSHSVPVCPSHCHLQYQAVVSVWHLKGYASVCVSEISQLKSQTWLITAAVRESESGERQQRKNAFLTVHVL